MTAEPTPSDILNLANAASINSGRPKTTTMRCSAGFSFVRGICREGAVGVVEETVAVQHLVGVAQGSQMYQEDTRKLVRLKSKNAIGIDH